MRKRIALGVSIPAVIVFVGILVALQLPANLLTLTEALDKLGLLGHRRRIAGLIEAPSGSGESPPLLILHGQMWDAAGGLRPNPGLLVERGRIAAMPAVAPHDAGDVRDVRVIDATGLTLLPGLIDMHVHAFGGTFDGEMQIGNGVTTARDLGTQLDGALRRRREAGQGARTAPRLFVTGPYLVSGAGAGDQEIGVTSPAAAAEIVGRFADAGVDGIKVHSAIDAAMLRAVVTSAHARGLWVAAHLDRLTAVEAAETGVDSIEHASGIDLDAGPAAQDAVISAMVSHQVALTPTLVVTEHYFTVADLARKGSPALEYVPRFFRRFWISSQLANADARRLTPDEIARRRVRLERLGRFTARFHQAGGRVLAGTDAPAFLVAPGFDIHRELELLVEAGLTREESLEAATHSAAIALRQAGEIGGLSPGMRADLILVSGIDATRDVRLVVKDGRVLLDKLTPSAAPK